MSRVTDYIAGLTPEERERFKDIIGECLDREAEIHASTAHMDRSLVNLKVESARMLEAMNDLLHDVEKLAKDIGLTCLRVIPTSGRPQ